MFKNLRDRLKGVSKKLEDELEAELEQQLEKELAEELAKEGGDDTAGSTEAPADERVADAPQPEPPEEPAAADDSPEAPRPDEEAGPDSRPAHEASPPTSRPDVDAESAAPEPVADESPPEPSEETGAAPEAEEAVAPSDADEDVEGGERQDERDETAEGTAPATPPADAAVAGREPSPAESTPEVSEPAPADAPRTSAKEEARPRVTGRKELTAEEIEARLRSELEEAVETQREVESVVRESGGTVSRFTINEDVLEDILWELEVGLLESDVALPVIEAIKENVKEQLLSMSVAGRSADQVVEKVLRTAIRRVLNVGSFDFDGFVKQRLEEGKKPVVVMFVGVNGTGKTTSIARIAHRLKGIGISSVMAAGDTFRAGAIEQLATHGDRLGVRVVKHSAGADPAAVAYDAIEHAKARRKDVVLLDTAGRMQTNTNLMDEMDKIRRVADPDLVVFVGDSLAGNDAVEQARRFDEVVDINGAILTKVDVDAKGGAALSVAYTINKPLLFVGVGQDYDDIRPFDADWMVDRLFGSEAAADAE